MGLGRATRLRADRTIEATAFVGEIPTGVVADVYSRRLSVIVGVLLYGVGWTVEETIPAFWAFLLSQVLWGTGSTSFPGRWRPGSPTRSATRRVGRLYVRGAQMSQLGSLLAIPVFFFFPCSFVQFYVLLWRKKRKVPPIKRLGAHIMMAGQFGLGNADPSRIEVRDVGP